MHDSAHAHTPLMQQYFAIKKQHPDALLLFQVGDFYELFFDDAKHAAAILGIALTKRGKIQGEDIPLCGIPVHVLDHYAAKLVRHGLKVALCEQLEEARPGKVVRRGVTTVLTPGTLTDSKLLDAQSASYLFSFFPQADSYGLLFGELLTAQLFATVVPVSSSRMVESELSRFFPDEILVPATQQARTFQPHFKALGYFVSEIDLDAPAYAPLIFERDEWIEQFKPEMRHTIMGAPSLRMAMTLFFTYLRKTNESAVSNFNQLKMYSPDDFLLLDAATQRNLELVRNSNDGGRKNTLLSVLDGAVTPMGSRTIKKWLVRPLVDPVAIGNRQDAVAVCVQDLSFAQALTGPLKEVGDIERVIGRIALGKAQLHDYLMLKTALAKLPVVQSLLREKSALSRLLEQLNEYIADFSALSSLLEASLYDAGQEEWLIKPGFSAELDSMRMIIATSERNLLDFERREQEATGISSLKVRYNQVQGYYIEITKANRDAIPSHYIYRQMLAGRERFTTAELQHLEYQLKQAQGEIAAVEKRLFETVKQETKGYVTQLRRGAHALAQLDALLGFARVAYERNYIRPTFNDARDILIVGGRHPVIEHTSDRPFVANDTALTDEQSLWIVTGPNMGGKSTYLRQVALITLMAQCGAFVPARSATLPILDRIFTRIGAGDNLAEGKSTFLVEMEETAAICSYATRRSLVILDEVGRGTSTFDGLAIAQAVVEYLYMTVHARCLFATHYHELTRLELHFPGIVSYYAASRKTDRGILFLYTMMRGVADGSFGIEVAKLARLPVAVVERAMDILEYLDTDQEYTPSVPLVKKEGAEALRAEIARLQQALQRAQETAAILEDINYDELSPKKAFDLLWHLREQKNG